MKVEITPALLASPVDASSTCGRSQIDNYDSEFCILGISNLNRGTLMSLVWE